MSMSDTLSKEKRSLNMSKIKAKDTVPELTVRSVLHKMGYRYRLHDKDLPSKPDIVLRKHKVIFFVNGCFWHQHPNCRRASMPKSNLNYWKPKLQRNVERFEEVAKLLKSKGWKVFVIWECQTKNIDSLSKILRDIMG